MTLLRETAVYGVASAVPRLLPLLTVPLYARVFSPSEYGRLDLVLTVITLASVLGMVQMESAVFRHFVQEQRLGRTARLTSTTLVFAAATSTACGVALVVVAPALASHLLGSSAYTRELALGALLVPLSNVFVLAGVVLRFQRGAGPFLRVALVHLAATVASVALLVGALGWGIQGVLAALAFGYAAGGVAALVAIGGVSVRAWDSALLRRSLLYCLPLLPSILGVWLNRYASRFAITEYLTLADVGLYSLALQIASIMVLVDSAFQMAWQPYFWRLFESPDHRRAMRSLFRYVVSASVGASLLIGLAAPEIVSLVAPREYRGAGSLAAALALAAGLTTCRSVVGLGPGIVERTIYTTLTVLAGAGLNVGLLLWLTPRFGLASVPFSVLGGTLAGLLLSWLVSERLYPFGFSLPYFLVVLGGALPVAVAVSLGAGRPARAILAVAVAAATLWAVRAPLVRQWRQALPLPEPVAGLGRPEAKDAGGHA